MIDCAALSDLRLGDDCEREEAIDCTARTREGATCGHRAHARTRDMRPPRARANARHAAFSSSPERKRTGRVATRVLKRVNGPERV
jgi:hypothetical protein